MYSQRQINGLKGSIKKWEGIVKGDIKDEGTDNCPLCKLYYDTDNYSYDYESSCSEKCPIYIKSGTMFCQNTPYQEWMKHTDTHEPNVITCTKCKRLARKELNFLKRLLKGKK